MFSLLIVAYLFIAGAGAGCFFIAAIGEWSQSASTSRICRRGFVLAPFLILTGIVFLLLDLGVPSEIWRIALNPFGSIIGIGAFLLTLLLIVSAALAYFLLLKKPISRIALKVFCEVGLVLSIGVMGYTGVFLSSMHTVGFWNTWLLPLLFLASSLSCGMALLMALDVVYTVRHGTFPRGVWICALWLNLAEAIALAAFLATRWFFSESSHTSSEILFFGDASGVFWVGVVLCGIVVPLILHIVAGKKPQKGLVLASSIATLIGGCSIRYCIVMVAVHATMVMG